MAGDNQQLSKREIEILQLLAHGKTFSQVARELRISTNTVKAHVKSIYGKVDVHNKGDAADWYWTNITQRG